MNNKKTVKSYVRRQGRMTLGQKKALEDLASRYFLTESAKHFDSGQRLALEIGFGMGDHLLELAKRFPDWQFLGSEVYLPGVGHLMQQLHQAGLNNVYLANQDVLDLLATFISDESLDLVFILFPDPWQKKRHHKRRLIQPGFLAMLSRKLKPAGQILIKTDWLSYAEHIGMAIEQTKTLKQMDQTQANRLLTQAIDSKYQRKAESEGRTIHSFYLARAESF